MKYLVLTTLLLIVSIPALAVDNKGCNFKPWQKKAFKDKEHKYCIDGNRLPLIWVDAQSAYHQKITVFVNEHRIFEAAPPKNVLFSGTVNQYLISGKENKIKVLYEIVETEVEPRYGAETFKLEIKSQSDWKNSKSVSLIKTIYGLDKNIRTVGTKGVIEDTFTLN